jgi:hypothetical protein
MGDARCGGQLPDCRRDLIELEEREGRLKASGFPLPLIDALQIA